MTKQNSYGITWTVNGEIKGLTIEARSLVEVLRVLNIKGITAASIIVMDSKVISSQGDDEVTQLELFKAA